MNENENNYQKEAIKRLEEHAEEGPMLDIEQPKHWLTLICIFGLLVVLILWSFFGRIPTEATGRSVSISSSGIFTIESPSTGTVTELYVTEGERVMEGTPLAKFYNPKLHPLISSIEATKFKIERLNNQSLLLYKALSINVSLYKQGLIPKMIIDQSRSSVMQKNIEIENAKSTLSGIFSELEENSFTGRKEFSHYKKLLHAPSDIIDFPEIQDALSILKAPSNGRILEVLANQGEILKPTETLFWMEHPQKIGETEVFYGTLNSETRGQIRPGLKVLIEPVTVNPREYGAIIGKIKSIYPYPVSKEELIQSIGNKQIVGYLLQNETIMTQITATPDLNPHTKSGYKWTSGTGPPFEIPTGTVCKMRVIVEEQPPISYLIPLWKIRPQ
ncbi:MAG: hypothetical protein K1000chlam2_01400 [Chlamydiae bacterium]|nr:hypothetical protein [Chlamydiota bacterium]